MSKLLYIESSPRKDRSASIEVAKSFIHTFQSSDSQNDVETLDLWSFSLPEIDENSVSAKFKVLHGENLSAEESKHWEAILRIVTQFKEADSYLFSIPMWNFSIPYKLKHFIDVITQPGLTFSFSPESGYQGLVVGKPATVILARGSEYSSAETSAMDFQKAYIEMILGFIGFKDIRTILVEPTVTDPETRNIVLSTARERATALAKQL